MYVVETSWLIDWTRCCKQCISFSGNKLKLMRRIKAKRKQSLLVTRNKNIIINISIVVCLELFFYPSPRDRAIQRVLYDL